MKIKTIIAGTLAFFVVQQLLGMFVTGAWIHEGILAEAYHATSQFWRPELTREPPDMAALMPYWITVAVISAFLQTVIFVWLRPVFTGPDWLKGLKFGLLMWVITAMMMAAWSGVFNLPAKIWIWWAIDMLIAYVISGPILGWVVGKLEK